MCYFCSIFIFKFVNIWRTNYRNNAIFLIIIKFLVIQIYNNFKAIKLSKKLRKKNFVKIIFLKCLFI